MSLSQWMPSLSLGMTQEPNQVVPGRRKESLVNFGGEARPRLGRGIPSSFQVVPADLHSEDAFSSQPQGPRGLSPRPGRPQGSPAWPAPGPPPLHTAPQSWSNE